MSEADVNVTPAGVSELLSALGADATTEASSEMEKGRKEGSDSGQSKIDGGASSGDPTKSNAPPAPPNPDNDVDMDVETKKSEIPTLPSNKKRVRGKREVANLGNIPEPSVQAPAPGEAERYTSSGRRVKQVVPLGIKQQTPSRSSASNTTTKQPRKRRASAVTSPEKRAPSPLPPPKREDEEQEESESLSPSPSPSPPPKSKKARKNKKQKVESPPTSPSPSPSPREEPNPTLDALATAVTAPPAPLPPPPPPALQLPPPSGIAAKLLSNPNPIRIPPVKFIDTTNLSPQAAQAVLLTPTHAFPATHMMPPLRSPATSGPGLSTATTTTTTITPPSPPLPSLTLPHLITPAQIEDLTSVASAAAAMVSIPNLTGTASSALPPPPPPPPNPGIEDFSSLTNENLAVWEPKSQCFISLSTGHTVPKPAQNNRIEDPKTLACYASIHSGIDARTLKPDNEEEETIDSLKLANQNPNDESDSNLTLAPPTLGGVKTSSDSKKSKSKSTKTTAKKRGRKGKEEKVVAVVGEGERKKRVGRPPRAKSEKQQSSIPKPTLHLPRPPTPSPSPFSLHPNFDIIQIHCQPPPQQEQSQPPQITARGGARGGGGSGALNRQPTNSKKGGAKSNRKKRWNGFSDSRWESPSHSDQDIFESKKGGEEGKKTLVTMPGRATRSFFQPVVSTSTENNNNSNSHMSLEFEGDIGKHQQQQQQQRMGALPAERLPTVEERVPILWKEKHALGYQHIDRSIYLIPRKKAKIEDADSSSDGEGEEHGHRCLCKLRAEEPPCGASCVNRGTNVECLRGNCLPGCTNQRMQLSQYKRLLVQRCGAKGYGLFADEDIRKGDFIIEYVGEVIGSNERDARLAKASEDNNSHFYFLAADSELTIDASRYGNASRFINHSCDPNCETQKWTIGSETRVGIFARRDIKKGEETNFDYDFDRTGSRKQKCHCGARECRQFIGPKNEKKIGYHLQGQGRRSSATSPLSATQSTSTSTPDQQLQPSSSQPQPQPGVTLLNPSNASMSTRKALNRIDSTLTYIDDYKFAPRKRSHFREKFGSNPMFLWRSLKRGYIARRTVTWRAAEEFSELREASLPKNEFGMTLQEERIQKRRLEALQDAFQKKRQKSRKSRSPTPPRRKRGQQKAKQDSDLAKTQEEREESKTAELTLDVVKDCLMSVLSAADQHQEAAALLLLPTSSTSMSTSSSMDLSEAPGIRLDGQGISF